MCMLCFSRPPFADPFADTDSPRALREKAATVKEQIMTHESTILSQLEAGNEPCQSTIQRLAVLKKRQYELSHKL